MRQLQLLASLDGVYNVTIMMHTVHAIYVICTLLIILYPFKPFLNVW
jgi:hypothetical protein